MSEHGFQIPAGALDKPDAPTAQVTPEHELLCECTGCGQTVLVGGYVDDLDPTLYRCLDCRPFKEDQPDQREAELADVIANARSKQGVS